jgi:hypothetical protein
MMRPPTSAAICTTSTSMLASSVLGFAFDNVQIQGTAAEGRGVRQPFAADARDISVATELDEVVRLRHASPRGPEAEPGEVTFWNLENAWLLARMTSR